MNPLLYNFVMIFNGMTFLSLFYFVGKNTRRKRDSGNSRLFNSRLSQAEQEKQKKKRFDTEAMRALMEGAPSEDRESDLIANKEKRYSLNQK